MKNGSFGSQVLGNTKPKPKIEKRISASKMWCFTLNNWTIEEYESIYTFLKNGSNGSAFIIGKEIGENQTPHLQGYVNFDKKCRPLEIKGLTKRIHWEKCNGTEEQNIKYCSKDGNFLIHNLEIKKDLKDIFKDDCLNTWWLLYIKSVIESKLRDKRTINWFYSIEGEIGKTAAQKYIESNYEDIIIIQGFDTAKNMMNLVFNAIKNTNKLYTILINLPKSIKATKDLYISLESIKDGIITNFKSFENGSKNFLQPHIFVFANYAPNIQKMSSDRWNIKDVSPKRWKFLDEIALRRVG